MKYEYKLDYHDKPLRRMKYTKIKKKKNVFDYPIKRISFFIISIIMMLSGILTPFPKNIFKDTVYYLLDKHVFDDTNVNTKDILTRQSMIYDSDDQLIQDDPSKQIEKIRKSKDIKFKNGAPILQEDRYNLDECNGGYLDSNNQCICPKKFMGDYCEILIDPKFACLGKECNTVADINGSCLNSFAHLQGSFKNPRSFGKYDYKFNGKYCKAMRSVDNQCYCTKQPQIQVHYK